MTRDILKRFPEAVRVEIDHYKDVFNRSRQQFPVQKQSQKLILAEKTGEKVYPGADVSQDFGHEHFYYTSSILNCIYNCSYCYLQGMFPSSNIVMFVNQEDFFQEVDALLARHPVYLAISYDTDLLAFERIAPFASRWIEFARERETLTIELRTKSVNYAAIRHFQPAENVVLAWTLSPDEVIRRYEPLTPSLDMRLKSMKQAMDDGWRVRVSFDPILYIHDWQAQYKACVARTFSTLPADKIEDVSIGVFRMARDYLKNIRRTGSQSDLIYYPFECRDGVYSYPEELAEQMIRFVRGEVEQYIHPENIYL